MHSAVKRAGTDADAEVANLPCELLIDGQCVPSVAGLAGAAWSRGREHGWEGIEPYLQTKGVIVQL